VRARFEVLQAPFVVEHLFPQRVLVLPLDGGSPGGDAVPPA
jgi:hypothetical protein